MKKTLKSAFLALMLALGNAHASDEYVGLHLTVPLGKEGMGMQLVLRRDNLEVRGGMDSNHRAQLGGGLTAGGNTTASAGFALSNYHRGLVPYIGASTEVYGDWEVGAVSYNTDLNYAYVGKRLGDDDEDNQEVRKLAEGSTGDDGSNSGGDSGGSSDGDTGTGGDSGGGSGDAGSGTGGEGGDGGDTGGDSDSGSDTGGSNHSGHGDGTNPGKGSGRSNSPNTGTDNPGHD